MILCMKIIYFLALGKNSNSFRLDNPVIEKPQLELNVEQAFCRVYPSC